MFELYSRMKFRPQTGVAAIFLATGLLTAEAETKPGKAAQSAQAGVGQTYEWYEKQKLRLQEGRLLFEKGQTQEALELFRASHKALSAVPEAVALKEFATEGYVSSGCLQAGEWLKAGDRKAALSLLNELDDPLVAAGDARVAKLRSWMNDPDRHPPALTPEHVKNVAEAGRLLWLADSQRETAQFDAALQTYEEVLRLDPYNTAARRGMERVEAERASYFTAARDHTRGKMLNEVNGAWEESVSVKNLSGLFGGQDASSMMTVGIRGGREAIQKKLREMVISQVDFSGASLDEVLEYLRVRTRDLDPSGKGIDFVLSLPPETQPGTISLNVRELPVEDVLRYACDMAGVVFKVEEYAVRLVSSASDSAEIISKTYRVPPDFISSSPMSSAAPAASADPFANSTPAATAPQLKRIGAKEFLEGQGVNFPEGASATFNPGSSTLIVRNTPKNLELVDMFVEQAFNRSPRQVVIEVKLMEVANNRLEELGFDWLLGGWGGDVQGAGGTLGNGQDAAFLTRDFPTQIATAAGTQALGVNPMTAGLRSSGDLPSNNIDSVLFGSVTPISKRSPGAFSVNGVLTNPQFQGVVRALDQKKGIDMVSQPSVVTRSGQKASVEIVRELIYPTEFDPPQVPTNVGSNAAVIVIDGNGNVIDILFADNPPPVVTPTTPTAFEMRKTGVVLEVEPVISEDGRSVDLAVTPDFTEFTGFVNYGSPIFGTFNGDRNLLTENFIFQPIFDTKKIVTAVNVLDGATVVLGGLVSDNSVVMQDKVPLLGDAPVLGRFFKSDVTRRMIKHVIFFVTVKVVDPSGKRINEN